jgi:hypothetical protein
MPALTRRRYPDARAVVLDGKGMKGALGVGHSVTFRTSPGRSISAFRVIVSRRFVSVAQQFAGITCFTASTAFAFATAATQRDF